VPGGDGHPCTIKLRGLLHAHHTGGEVSWLQREAMWGVAQNNGPGGEAKPTKARDAHRPCGARPSLLRSRPVLLPPPSLAAVDAAQLSAAIPPSAATVAIVELIANSPGPAVTLR